MTSDVNNPKSRTVLLPEQWDRCEGRPAGLDVLAGGQNLVNLGKVLENVAAVRVPLQAEARAHQHPRAVLVVDGFVSAVGQITVEAAQHVGEPLRTTPAGGDEKGRSCVHS
jgi:hypothetical protein